jgi:hypothetical protein
MVLPCLLLGTEEIPLCDVATYMGGGHWWSSSFWSTGYESVFRVYATLHRLRLLKFLTPKRVRLKLCKALPLPYFFYCDIVFSHLSSVDSIRLQVAFNTWTRYVSNLRYYDHLSTRRYELLGVPLFDYYDLRVFSFFFKLILTQRPGYFFADLIGVRSLRTSNFLSVSKGGFGVG